MEGQLTVVLKRHHFPEKLDDMSISQAFWDEPCILEKAINEQHPDLDYHHVDIYGNLYHEKGHLFGCPEPIGSVQGEFTSSIAYRLAKELKKDPEYTETFIINYL